MKVGFVNIFGKPNAGKSTLLNALIGEKMAIVSMKMTVVKMKVHKRQQLNKLTKMEVRLQTK